jgi:uncharacterized membrane protein
MRLWGATFGALFGWAIADFEPYGLILGGLVGLLAGFWLRSSVEGVAADTLKRIVDAELKDYIARQIDLALAGREAVPPPAPDSSQRVTVPATRRAAAKEAIPAVALAAITPPAPPPTPPEQDQTPSEPNPVERSVQAVREWFLGGNTIVRVGLVILFVGLSFLARYAAAAGLFPIELRLALVAAAGAGLLAVGFNRRVKRPEFGLALQGGGVAVLYLTVFAAARVFDVMPPLAAFGLMVIIAALGCALALLQDSRAMAVMSFAGGFAVPVLLGGESKTPLPLFTYGTVLNLAILYIARWKSWRALNLLGFFASFGIAGLWAAARYAPEHFLICQVFLGLTVAIYLLTAILYAHNTPGKFGLAADSTLLFGTALVGFGLQAQLVADRPFGQAFAALAFGAVYVALAAWVWRRPRPETRVLGECLIAIGVGFVTLAIPLALDVRWISSAWALEGAGAFWVGARQARWMPRAFGLLLVALAAGIALVTLEPNIAALPLANNTFVELALIAGPLLAISWWLRRDLPHSGSRLAHYYAPLERGLDKPVFLLGWAFAALALVQEVARARPDPDNVELVIPLFTMSMQQLMVAVVLLLTMAAGLWTARRTAWPVAAWPARLAVPLALITLVMQVASGQFVLTWPDVLPWLGVLILLGWILYQTDALPEAQEGTLLSRWQGLAHAGTAWLLAGILANSLYLGIDRADLWETSWAGVVFLVAGTVALLALVRAGDWQRTGAAPAKVWPLARHGTAWWWIAAVPIAVLVLSGAFGVAWLAEGVTDPLPYIPLLNPVDLSVLLALAALALWRNMAIAAQPLPDGADMLRGPVAPAIAALLGFVAINAIWLRTAHHWLGVAWHAATLADSPVVQAGLSILWTVLAMALMLLAKRHAMRPLWLLGAGLLALVVAKLLLVDMSSAEGWQRIVTFIVVGLMMLVIGYFVPLPPRKVDAAGPEGAE